MFAIPRVNSFFGFNLKSSLLTCQIIGILSIFFGIAEYFILSNSLESIFILLVLNVLPLTSATACIYGIIKNKPKFMLLDLIGGIFCIFMLVIVILVYPEFVIAAMKKSGRLATLDAVIFLRYALLIWISICIATGAIIYYVIALYSLYMSLTEGRLNMAHDTHFVLNMGQQANFV